MVTAMLTKAPALAPTKVRTRETQGKEAKAEGFKLRRHCHKSTQHATRATQHATREVKLSAENWNIVKITGEALPME